MTRLTEAVLVWAVLVTGALGCLAAGVSYYWGFTRGFMQGVDKAYGV